MGQASAIPISAGWRAGRRTGRTSGLRRNRPPAAGNRPFPKPGVDSACASQRREPEQLAAQQPFGHGLRVVGMDLDREAIAGEDIFEQQGQVAPVGSFEPDFADLAVRARSREDRRQVRPPPWLFDILGTSFCISIPSLSVSMGQGSSRHVTLGSTERADTGHNRTCPACRPSVPVVSRR